MSTATKTLITTTVKITGMSRDTLQNLVLDILASNPTIVYNAMGVGEVGKTYKVVVTAKGTNKIHMIKHFREITGAGLADSKYWTEGTPYDDLPAGVFAMGKTKEAADELAAKLNTDAREGMRVMVLRDDVDYTYDANWGGTGWGGSR